MGQYIVSARKYRPSNFETLIGQDNIARTLKNSILRNQLAHAYLFCGPRGVGKTSTARIFAKTINCSNPGKDMEPCGECESCRSFIEGRSYCIHELDAASNNSVEDIRALMEQVAIPPQVGNYSVYIIDEVHMLSQAAFNAFLKTLEEPPAYAIFILATTEKHKILPTILSRCQTYDFNRISIEDIVKNLKAIASAENVNMSEDAMHIIAQKADGAMRDALTLFDQTVAFCGNEVTYDMVIKNFNVLDYEYYFKLSDYFLAGDYASALLTFDDILKKGFNALHFISGLSSHFRDLIVSKNGASSTLAELAPSVAAKYKDFSDKFTIEFLFNALSCTTSCETAYRQSGNPRLLIEFALMKLSQMKAKLTAPAAQTVSKEPSAATAPAVSTQEENAVPQSKTASSLPSIKSMLRQVSQTVTNHNDDKQDVKTIDFNMENVLAAWKKLAESESSMPRLSSAISNCTPVVEFDAKIIHFKVSNSAQKDWIDKNCRTRLESFLRSNLSDTSISLFVEVTVNEDKDDDTKLYMPSQKVAYLKETNEQFRELAKDLDLETA